jgi:RNA polymerase sigma-70 factor (ECF subfamily)
MNNKIFKRAFKETSSYIYTLSYRLTGTSDEAEDLMQETYIHAHDKWQQLKNIDNPGPWLRKICLNLFIQRNRKTETRYRMKETVFPVDDHNIISRTFSPEQEYIFNYESQKIQSQCYSILTSSLCIYQRIVFVLVDIFEIKIDEVSEIIGKPKPATKSLLHRARNKMNKHLASICSLANSENICKCSSWISFAHDINTRRAHLKEIIKNRKKDYDKESTNSNLAILYKTLPYLNPTETISENYNKKIEPFNKKLHLL